MTHPVRILEVGPRDGLQNEKAIIPLKTKIEFVNLLSASGVSEIEVGAFVSPRWVPQMAESDELLKRIERNPDVIYSALVPNERGLDRALEAGVEKIAVFTAASETFNRRNINASISESLDRFDTVIRRSHEEKLPVRGYISTVFFCPYEGQMAPLSTIPVAEVLLELGVEEVCLADTVGEARPDDVRQVLEQVVKLIPPERLAMHFHDTYHHATENALVAWREFGIEVFDSSAGGLGGCPYAEGATGNVATESLVRAFVDAGADLAIDIDTVKTAARLVGSYPDGA
jgi:hydroxymethylglutaryl-CoA lyase